MRVYRTLAVAAMVLAVLPGTAAYSSFVVDLELVQNGDDRIHNIQLSNRTIATSNTSGQTTFTVVLNDGEAVLTRKTTGVTLAEDPHVYSRDTPSAMKRVSLPYNESATTVSMERDGNEVARASIVDEVCTMDDRCPAYCQVGDRSDPDCKQETGPSLPVSLPVALFIAVAGILVLVALYVLRVQGR